MDYICEGQEVGLNFSFLAVFVMNQVDCIGYKGATSQDVNATVTSFK